LFHVFFCTDAMFFLFLAYLAYFAYAFSKAQDVSCRCACRKW
jgi:hypothetical protein